MHARGKAGFMRILVSLLGTAPLSTALILCLKVFGQTNSETLLQPRESPRQLVVYAMEQRPNDPWPRGEGHVILARPGSWEMDKAYLEPGGGFSPAVGTFGVSLWLANSEGDIRMTSDNSPIDEVRQQFVWSNDQPLPVILTCTPYYEARWASCGDGCWRLLLDTKNLAGLEPWLVIRSVGSAGGPIRSLRWDGDKLFIRGDQTSWTLTLSAAPPAVCLGEEGNAGWKTARPSMSHWESPAGWGHARINLSGNREWQMTFQNCAPLPVPELRFTSTRASVAVQVPDARFAASLNAQVANLMMGLVGTETRPGDPMNYPLAWLRDGSYSVVALARAGQVEVAKQLARYFAEHDFFGGFGPEADAPGLSLWAIEEVAVLLKQPEFDRWLWPHVYRKAEFILTMVAAKRPIHQVVFGPIVPSHLKEADLSLVCDPSRDGLVVGRMDWHRPILFVNAVSYRGLLSAAELAERVHQPETAKRWRASAVALKQAWEAAFNAPESENDRTYISGLWPTWIAKDITAQYQRGLEARWNKIRDAHGGFRQTPLWTYFDIAEAHQWLFLGRPDRVWNTLEWFWEHQVSPGLYTWWEGEGEENSFHLWEQVRGWVKPPHVTPHYWTAAEMLLLQLDTLGYVTESDSEPTLVIGAGVAPAWLSHQMSVYGLRTKLGEVDWVWRNSKVEVSFHGHRCAVRLGPAFPRGTPVEVK